MATILYFIRSPAHGTGVGEPACNAVPAAIAHAVFDAIGVRIRRLPLRPDRVKAPMQH
jgi:CO/xanthine dehydrogenase Mo-binding subunit